MFFGYRLVKYATNNGFLSSIYLRNISSLGLWHIDISTEIKKKIETHWAHHITSKNNDEKCLKDTYYVLPMFPYPSGNLHMGHVRVYTISDAIARFHRLDGKNVVHPIGWDAFGLPAENAAIERNIEPSYWTKMNIQSMKKQLLMLGYDFDWTRELCTCEPEYYKWTQYIFLKMFEHGLAYQSKAKVNWDPVDKTVLADEQVDEFGNSWRSGAKVEKKVLTQWFVKTTKLAKDLYDGLNKDNLEDWKDIINLQKHWIGDCNGVVVNFETNIGNEIKAFDVWTPEPYKFIYGQFIVFKTNNVIVEGLGSEALKDLKCFNPITKMEIPVYVTDNFDYPPERDAYIACPAINNDDRKLAETLNVSIVNINYSFDLEKENQQAIDIAQKENVGGYRVSSKLKDWLISRQRYWGTPIPIIHCKQCGPTAVPYESLPVVLPNLDSLKSGSDTLNKLKDWVNCLCPKCSSQARRETDTMDTFVDSSWYYYRFLDPSNNFKPFDKAKLEGKIPVNVYVGGKEHAVLHLYYARFVSYFLHMLGWSPNAEPFKKLVVQGMVMGQSYKVKSSGKYISPDSVEKVGEDIKEKNTGEPVLVQWEKMSKSKYNGENPEKLLATYGCDTTRLLMLADVPPATTRRWSEATLPGVLNWQHRLWLTVRDFLKCREQSSFTVTASEEFRKQELKIRDARNYFIATATYHFKHTYKLSVGISRLQSLTNTLRNQVAPDVISNSIEFELALASLIIMLSPVTPHFSSELWAGFVSAPKRISDTPKRNSRNTIQWDKNVLDQSWPRVDDDYSLSFLCKVDGADRCDMKIKSVDLAKLDSESALKIMTNEKSVASRLKSGIFKIKYELYPGCRAILNIYTNKKPKEETLKNYEGVVKQ